MAQHTIDLAAFRVHFPAFADATKFSDAYVTATFDAAGSFINPWDSWLVSGSSLQQALNFLTAHLLQLQVAASAGGVSPSVGFVQSASIDKVAVTLAVPPTKSGWDFWLASTPYGLQLWALLKMLTGPGFYVGGRPERAAFRKVGGLF